MSSTRRGTAASLLGTIIALTAWHGAQAQTKAPAYVVNEIEVTDPAGFQTYAARQGALLQSFGGRFLVRGGATETIAGTPVGQRVVIYVFEGMDKLEAWRKAPEQQELTAIRDRSSRFRSFAVEGLAN